MKRAQAAAVRAGKHEQASPDDVFEGEDADNVSTLLQTIDVVHGYPPTKDVSALPPKKQSNSNTVLLKGYKSVNLTQLATIPDSFDGKIKKLVVWYDEEDASFTLSVDIVKSTCEDRYEPEHQHAENISICGETSLPLGKIDRDRVAEFQTAVVNYGSDLAEMKSSIAKGADPETFEYRVFPFSRIDIAFVHYLLREKFAGHIEHLCLEVTADSPNKGGCQLVAVFRAEEPQRGILGAKRSRAAFDDDEYETASRPAQAYSSDGAPTDSAFSNAVRTGAKRFHVSTRGRGF